MEPERLLSVAEAAVVADVRTRDVNRVLDEDILPEDFRTVGDGRLVAASACGLIAFYFDSAERLTAAERLHAIRTVAPRLVRGDRLSGRDWAVRHDFLTIDLGPFLTRALDRLHTLRAASARVVSSPEILGGTPVFVGTRVPVHDVAAAVAAGVPAAEILEDYPSLPPDALELAAIYAAAHPRRGRPPAAPAILPPGARLLSQRRVTRGRAG